MKRNLFDVKTVLVALCFVLSIAALAFAQNKPNVSKEEIAAADKVKKAVDIPAKFQAANEFVKKFPASSLRQEIARHIIEQIKAVKDAGQQVAFSEQFFNIFTDTSDTDEIIPTLIDGYVKAKKYDEAFQTTDSYISRHPESLNILVDMAILGSNLARQQNPKFANQSISYGNKAIAIIEADKKPANATDAEWAEFKKSPLASIYQSVGVLLFMNNNIPDARAKLEKAVAVTPSDPRNLYFLGAIAETEYQATAKEYKAASSEKQRNDLLAKANSQLDIVIDYYARAVAAADGKAEFNDFVTQIRGMLEPYYKYRNKDKLDGLQELINKYKPKP